jgi:catechol 2,3-dioxygenase-like lactoylglutathione lyase family enzyme
MNRFHVHVGVADIETSVAFYTQLFGAAPSVRKSDYAKWMLDDPRINFAISQRDPSDVGINHLGLQVESDDELAGLRSRFEAADRHALVDEPTAQCCYAKCNKHWTTDPQGIAWEAFHSLESVPYYFGVEPSRPEASAITGLPLPHIGAKRR